MNYELVSVLRSGTDNWKVQKERAEKNNSTLITLFPDPFFVRLRKEEYPTMINIVDYVTKRTYDESSSLFFDKVDTVEGAEIIMNRDGVITLVKEGVIIGEMRVFARSRRLVQDIKFFNADGSRDMVEEYTFDGKLFSNIFYFEDNIQEIDFFNDNRDVRLRFYFYEGSINLITVENPKTKEVIEKYDNMSQFQAAQVAKIVKPEDEVGITYLGVELDALKDTQSKNTL
ncbi:MAG: hypothetical protein LKG71_08420 [Pediococcus acidilactici]|jgi:hypothetical protein|nr:hypothetical protein [Pediococcus acidilactici]MCI1548163.1 hypothetical protein [Pediococcus acidilactici]